LLARSSEATLIGDFLLTTAERVPEAIALVGDEQRLSYRDLSLRAWRVARALEGRGVGRGDRVMLFSTNSIDMVVAFWAVVLAGGVAVPIGATTKADKLAWLIEHCDAAAVITEKRLSPVLAAAPAASRLRAVFVSDSSAPWSDASDLASTHALPDHDAPVCPVAAADLAAIIYTSGSTGRPKGVMLSHRNMVSAAGSISQYLGIGPDDVIQVLSPMSFDYGLYQCLLSARQACRLVLAPPLTLPGQVLRQTAAEHVTFFPGVPTLFAMLYQLGDVSPWDLSRVRAVTSTGAALTEQHIAMVRRIFPAARIYSMYGVTECKRCSYLPPEDIARKPGSVGLAIPGTELWLEDEQHRPVGPNRVGQIVVRGPHVMQGYWRDPVATARVLRPGRRTDERVLCTGDLGRLDEDGYLYFVGRTDDIIKSGGEKVAPKEVEMVLAAIPGVKEVAVVGVADRLLGQAVKAFVVTDSTLTEADLLRACRARLEAHMVPGSIVLMTALPRNANGKIDKQALKSDMPTASLG
jgi:amino acid adenylation domain-containing protein